MVGDFFCTIPSPGSTVVTNIVWQKYVLIINGLYLPNNIWTGDAAGDPAGDPP
jgi:hypothetical protein